LHWGSGCHASLEVRDALLGFFRKCLHLHSLLRANDGTLAFSLESGQKRNPFCIFTRAIAAAIVALKVLHHGACKAGVLPQVFQMEVGGDGLAAAKAHPKRTSGVGGLIEPLHEFLEGFFLFLHPGHALQQVLREEHVLLRRASQGLLPRDVACGRREGSATAATTSTTAASSRVGRVGGTSGSRDVLAGASYGRYVSSGRRSGRITSGR
jgi:hypothetical protein